MAVRSKKIVMEMVDRHTKRRTSTKKMDGQPGL